MRFIMDVLPSRMTEEQYVAELQSSRGWDVDPSVHKELIILARLEEIGIYLRYRLLFGDALLDFHRRADPPELGASTRRRRTHAHVASQPSRLEQRRVPLSTCQSGTEVPELILNADQIFDFNLLRWMGAAPYYGADIAEFLDACDSRLRSWISSACVIFRSSPRCRRG